MQYCESRGLDYGDLTDDQLASVDPRLTPAVREVLTIEAALEAHSGFGGTAPARVEEQLTRLRAGWTRCRAGPALRGPAGAGSRGVLGAGRDIERRNRPHQYLPDQETQ